MTRAVAELDEEDGVTAAAGAGPSEVVASPRAVAFAESLAMLSLGDPF